MPVVRDHLSRILLAAVTEVLESAQVAVPVELAVELSIPKFAEQGDFSTNAAMPLASMLKQSPRQIGSKIIECIRDPDGIIDHVEIAGPGFINFFIKQSAWKEVLTDIASQSTTYGTHTFGRGEKVQVEFVSANPTGPLHIGHGRGAATGAVLGNLLRACGYDVELEYYINDAGNQMDTLGRSLYYRYLQVLGKTIDFPENHYQGEYMVDLAKEFVNSAGDKYVGSALENVLSTFTQFASDRILDGIKDDLRAFGVSFDSWFSERTLHESGAVESTLRVMESKGFVYESEGAKWFRSTAFDDEKDRVVIRANGISTYFAADLAYHHDKFERGFDKVVDVWGADHHGYVDRMSAGVQAMGRGHSDLRVVLVQLVNLLRGGSPVAMSTRSGEFVTLREVLDEVGSDAARFIFLMRRSDSSLDFDLEVAKMQSNDNPVYYVQYAHARLCSIFEVARDRGIEWKGDESNMDLLTEPSEIEIMRLLGEYPDVLANACKLLEPHHIPYYLNQLVSAFHSYYSKNRVLSEDLELTRARLSLAAGIRDVIRNGLQVLGVSAPQKM